MEIEEFSKNYSFSKEEKEKIVKQLESLIQHIESDSWPRLILYKCEKDDLGITFNISLSHPWPG